MVGVQVNLKFFLVEYSNNANSQRDFSGNVATFLFMSKNMLSNA